jgi:hypothetical protein
MVVLPHDRGRLFYAIVTEMRYRDKWFIISAIYALINLAKVSGRILFFNDLLSNSSATPTKCWWIVVKNIF